MSISAITAQTRLEKAFPQKHLLLKEFKGMAQPAMIVCPIHGEQVVNNFDQALRSKHGCPQCGREASRRKSSERLKASKDPSNPHQLSPSDSLTLEHLINRLLLIQKKEQELDAILRELESLLEDPNLQPEDLRRKITELRARSPWFNHTVNPDNVIPDW